MAESINVGQIQADLDVNSGNLVRGLATARDALKGFQKELQALTSEFKSGAIDFDQYATRANVINRTMSDMKTAMVAAYTAANQLGNVLDVANQKTDAKAADSAAAAAAKKAAIGQKLMDDLVNFAIKEANEEEASRRKSIQAQIADLDKVIAAADRAAQRMADADAKRERAAEAASRRATMAQIADLDKVIAAADAAAARMEADDARRASRGRTQAVAGHRAAGEVAEINANLEAMAAFERSAQRASATAVAGANASRNAYGGLGMAIMQVGYMVDDLQYGFSAIVNNIAPFTSSIASAFGASIPVAQGWAAAIQIAAVAAYQLYAHWNQIKEAMDIPILRTKAEEMEELGKKTKKTADELERLAKYEHERSEAKSLMGKKPELEEKAEHETEKAIAEFGSGRAKKAIAESLTASGMAPKLSEGEIDKIFKETVVGGTKREYARFDAKVRAREEADLDAMVEKIMVDPAERARLMKHAPPELRKELERATPEAIKARELEKAKEKMDREEAETDEAARKAGAADTKRKRHEEERAKKEEEDREREFRKENVEAARKILPGFDEKAKGIAAATIRGGRSKEEAIASMTAELKLGKDGKFMSDEDAKAAAKDTVGKEFDEFEADPHKLESFEKSRATKGGKVPGFAEHMQGLMGMLGQGGNRLAQNSEVGNIEDMTAKIQAGTGTGENELQKQLVDIQKQAQEYLKTMAEKTSEGVLVKVT